jgi:hypothetical protein
MSLLLLALVHFWPRLLQVSVSDVLLLVCLVGLISALWSINHLRQRAKPIQASNTVAAFDCNQFCSNVLCCASAVNR